MGANDRSWLRLRLRRSRPCTKRCGQRRNVVVWIAGDGDYAVKRAAIPPRGRFESYYADAAVQHCG